MPSVIGTNLAVIAQAVEAQLLGSAVVGDITNIYWVMQGEEPPPGTTGQRDILLIFREDSTEGTVVGGGRFAWIASMMDVNLRSSLALDRRGTRKDFLIAHRAMIDALMDSLMGFFPVDSAQNALTIEGFVLETNAAPAKSHDTQTWGYTVGSYSFHYMPNINLGTIG